MNESESAEFNRRDFLKGGSFAALMTMLGGAQLFAQAAEKPAASSAAVPKLKCAVIGLGAWGREILSTLGRLPQAEVAAICDTYPASLRRSASSAPGATQTADYKTILDSKEIKAVFIATPTHLHKEIALAALKAGKHVYCEAPLANTVEDAREIALAAKAASNKQVFQSGLQLRADPQRHFVLPFIRSGALGKLVMARSQAHKKQSWRGVSPNAEREKELNWRLDKTLSPGLIGEIGLHQIDQASWVLNGFPLSVTGFGFGSTIFWKDGREVADTVQAMIEYPNGVNLIYDCTLANSFDSDYEMYYGSDAAVMMRENKAWMFKEVDSPLLGWEVYARKDSFYKETGIALVADATKLSAQGQQATEELANTKPPLYFALESFLANAYLFSSVTDDFIATYGSDDLTTLVEQLSKIPKKPSAGFIEGFQATVTALKINEAVVSGQRLSFKPEWFELG
jgi:predicted dehydrogenase